VAKAPKHVQTQAQFEASAVRLIENEIDRALDFGHLDADHTITLVVRGDASDPVITMELRRRFLAAGWADIEFEQRASVFSQPAMAVKLTAHKKDGGR